MEFVFVCFVRMDRSLEMLLNKLNVLKSVNYLDIQMTAVLG